MLNILDLEDRIKGLPDAALMRGIQKPSADVPQYLLVSELQRRNEMRQSYDAMAQPSSPPPVAETIVAEAGGGISGVVGGNPLPVSAPMPRPQAPAGIVGMQSGRTAPNIYDTSLFSERVQEVIGQRPEGQSRVFKSSEERREEQEEKTRRRTQSLALREQVRRDAIDSGLTIPEASDLADSVYITDDGQVQFPSPLDLTRVPSRTAARVTEYDPPNVSNLPFGESDPDSTLDPILDPSGQDVLASYNNAIMDATKSGRESIASLRDQISGLTPYQSTFTERDFIRDTIDRQSYIDKLSDVADQDLASRQVLIDEIQEKSKKDALNAFLMSFGAGVAAGDLSSGLEQGSKAAQDIKQLADQRLLNERKAMRDAKSAAEREAIQLGLSDEEAELAGRRAEQKFEADQEALRNTVEFRNYTASRQQLLDQIEGARQDVTTIAALIKSEADIVNDANRIRQQFEEEQGRERRDIRNYIEEFVKAHRETLEASVVGISDPSSVTNLVDSYRKLLEQEFNLREADDESSSQSAVDELVDASAFSINR